MPSIRYFNQTAPFWDFIANLEATGADHPFFSAYNPESRSEPRDQPQAQASDAPGAAAAGENDGPAPPPEEPGSGDHPPHHGHHGHHGHPWGPGFPFGGRRGGSHCRGGPHGGFRRGGRCGGGPPPFGFGGWAAGNPGPLFDMSKIAEFFAAQFGPDSDNKKDGSTNNNNSTSPKDFSPPADVFDTEDAYIVHISLPGAKKEDVGVNWDADKSELSIAGVIYRPGDEDFLKTLALDERHVGVFERKIRLGSRANPAQVDADAISARMEDGVLVVNIPKLDREYVEVKKVDIE